MTTLPEEQKREIMATLLEAGAILPCPRCGQERFEVLDGYIVEFTQSQLRNMVVGSNNRYATVATVCSRCGFLAQHALQSPGTATTDDAGHQGAGQLQQPKNLKMTKQCENGEKRPLA